MVNISDRKIAVVVAFDHGAYRVNSLDELLEPGKTFDFVAKMSQEFHR